jgi:hypothetical protein
MRKAFAIVALLLAPLFIFGLARVRGQAGAGASPGGSSGASASVPSAVTWYFAQNCGGNQNCTAVKWDVAQAQDVTTNSANNIVTCPNADCHFLTTAKPGQIFFATDNTTAPTAVGVCYNNAFVTFGGLNQTTISTVDSDTQIHVVGNAGSTVTANACAAWGDDDTTAINAGVNAAPCTANFILPLGYTFFSAPIFQPNPSCPLISAEAAFQGQQVTGQNIVGTFFVPTPNFNFSSINGLRAACPAGRGAIGNCNIVQYKDFTVYGLGQRCTATQASTVLLYGGSAARMYNIDGVGWCGQGGGTSLVGVGFYGALDRWEQGGSIFFGSEGVDIEAEQVHMQGNFFSGMSSNTATVSRCLTVVGETNSAASLIDINSWHQTCIAIYAGAEATLIHDKVQGNPTPNPDGACINMSGAGAALNLISNDKICGNSGSGEAAIQFFAAGTVTASRSIISSNTFDVVGFAGSIFNDVNGNTFNTSTGIWNGIGTWQADGHSLKAACTGVATASSTLALISSGTSLAGVALPTACTGTVLDKGIAINGARTLQNLNCTSSATTVSVACTVMTSHNGGAFAASTITCTMTAATSCKDSFHTLAVADGDFVTIEIVTGAAETGANIKAFVTWQ